VVGEFQPANRDGAEGYDTLGGKEKNLKVRGASIPHGRQRVEGKKLSGWGAFGKVRKLQR